MSDSSAEIEARSPAMQFIRYGLVGIASNISGYLIYLLITYWGADPKKTMTLLYLTGASIGFYGNRHWAFAHKGALLPSGVRYFVAHFFGYLINLFILLMFVDRLNYSHQWVQAVAIIIVASFLFLAFKYFVFPRAGSDAGGGK
ncbi:MAG: GtrA family protein [Pseudomonadota bacterium]